MVCGLTVSLNGTFALKDHPCPSYGCMLNMSIVSVSCLDVSYVPSSFNDTAALSLLFSVCLQCSHNSLISFLHH